MARPSRCRRICFEPEYDSFAPCGSGNKEQIFLAVDEYEAVRLIDFEKKTHEKCAEQMGISRTTVTEMYERARYKIADCLVNGKTLRITGGNYTLCSDSMWGSCGKNCSRKQSAACCRTANQEGAEKRMKIAVTYENGNVFQHFGHTENFKLYDVEDGQIKDAKVVETAGSGHGALAGFLSEHQVDALICGGIGGGAQTALAEAGIKLYGGVSGDADEAVRLFLDGKLSFDANVHCDHHEHHGEGHQCGENKHGCGGNGGSCR